MQLRKLLSRILIVAALTLPAVLSASASAESGCHRGEPPRGETRTVSNQ